MLVLYFTLTLYYWNVLQSGLVWLEEPKFQGFGCSACDWRFKPSAVVVGKSLDEMKRKFETRHKLRCSHLF